MITTVILFLIIGDIAATAAQCRLNQKMMKDIRALQDANKEAE
jgi:hypothetical protein